MSMSPKPTTPAYVLGQSETESQRLIRQGDFLRPVTERVFREAGMAPGMRVLDLGCGAGDVCFLISGLIGPTGSVLGIDRDPTVLGVARERATQYGLSNVAFEESTIDAFNSISSFDAIVGRFVLLYQPDPAMTLRHVAKLAHDGGILAFVETDLTIGLCSWPLVPLWEQIGEWILETFQRGGVHYDLGSKLYPAFMQAGLPGPLMRQDCIVGGGTELRPVYEYFTAMLRSLLPAMEKLGIATGDSVQIDTLAERLEHDVIAVNSQVITVPVFGAWTRKLKTEE